MATDEGGQYLADRGAIGEVVTGDPLQCIDSTKPHVKLGVAELVDRTSEALGICPCCEIWSCSRLLMSCRYVK
jgi:hypothetical protein